MPRPPIRARVKASVSAVCAALVLAAVAVAGSWAADSAEASHLLRFPTLSRDAIAFAYAGDIWSAPRAGGLARQLTTDPGLELFPRYSPDGRFIAFTGEYDGNRDVYVIPAEGGEPKRLTFWTDIGHVGERMGPNNEVIGWTPDGTRVLFRSRHQAWESRAGRLFTVGLDGSLPQPLTAAGRRRASGSTTSRATGSRR